MWLYYVLHTISTVVSWLPYKLVVILGKGVGHLYHKIAKKQRIRAEETIKERLGYDDEKAYATIKRLFIKLYLLMYCKSTKYPPEKSGRGILYPRK